MSAVQADTWAVLGGGILGQALALRLQKAGKRVTLIEAAPELGGLAMAQQVGGITYDKFYHVILPFDKRTLALLDEIGLGSDVEWRSTRTGFFSEGRLMPLNGALDYLRLRSIGLVTKLRVAYLLMTAGRIRDGEPLEQVSVQDWLTRWCGKAGYEKLWRPLLRAKLGDNASKASAAFIWSSIRRLYLARQGVQKVEQLGFVKNGGYARILNVLRDELVARGIEIQTNTPVSRVYSTAAGVCIETPSGRQVYENVVSTLPTKANLAVCEGLKATEKARLDGVVYQGIICASVVLDRPLAGYYLTYLTDEALPFTGIVEMSALTGTGAFDGKTLVYLPRYVTQDDPYWTQSDEKIALQFMDALRKVHPDVTSTDILDIKISRVREVMAVPTIGYRENAPQTATSVPGLYFVNSAQIIDGTLNVDATLGVLDEAMPKLDLGRTTTEARPAA